MEAAAYVLDKFEPACRRTWRAGGLDDRVDAARRELENCRACPRACGVDRLHGQTRVCHVGRHALVASAFAHHGEEDCLRGWRGSGTIFFGACNLRCTFCQNWDISQRRAGREHTAEELCALMLRLQDEGCHNVNLVTPEHVAPQIVEALALAAPRLEVPVVYNTSAYDALVSLRLAAARDYPERARAAILEMQHQVGPLTFGRDGLARRGLLVRHLVMPGLVDEAAAIFEWLARAVSPDTYVNVMAQYRPAYRVGQPGLDGTTRFPEIDRRPTRDEIAAACAVARRAGLWRFDSRV